MNDLVKSVLHSDLVKYVIALGIGVVGSVYTIKSDLRSLQEHQAITAATIERAMSSQDKRDQSQDDRITQVSRDMLENARELRGDIKDLRSDIRSRK